MKSIIIIFCIIFTYYDVKCQRELHFTNYIFQGVLVNPAYAGAQSKTQLSVGYRSNWINLKTSPKSFAFTFDTPLIRQKSGIGLFCTKESFGFYNQTNILISFSYRLRVWGGTLGFGFENGYRQSVIDYSTLNILNLDDELLKQNNKIGIWDYGLGLYFQSKKFQLALASKRLNKNIISNTTSDLHLNKYFSLLSSYKVDINKFDKLLITGFGNFSYNIAPYLESNVIFQQRMGLNLGLGCRSIGEIMFISMLSFHKLFPKIKEDMSLAYAFDYGFKPLQNINSNSHEILLVYKFATRPNPEQILKNKTAVHPIFF